MDNNYYYLCLGLVRILEFGVRSILFSFSVMFFAIARLKCSLPYDVDRFGK